MFDNGSLKFIYLFIYCIIFDVVKGFVFFIFFCMNLCIYIFYIYVYNLKLIFGKKYMN